GVRSAPIAHPFRHIAASRGSHLTKRGRSAKASIRGQTPHINGGERARDMVRSGVTVYSTPGGRHLRWMTSSMGAPTGRAGENPSAGPKGTGTQKRYRTTSRTSAPKPRTG